MSPVLILLDLSIWTLTFASQKNLSTVPHPISQTWELTIPIPHWILAFFHIEEGLLITFEVTILAHQTAEIHNTFAIEIIFRWHLNILYPHPIKESRIVLGYLWPNSYYQVNQEEIIHVPSSVSLATGVTASDGSTYAETPSLPSTPEILPQLELPVPPNHFTAGLRVPSILPSQSMSNSPTQMWRPRPITADFTVEQLLAQIRSRVDLDQPAVTEGNITYQHLQNIDRNPHPEFYTKLSNTVDDNYKQPHHKEIEFQGEDKECPLPIPGLLGTHLRIPESEHNLEE